MASFLLRVSAFRAWALVLNHLDVKRLPLRVKSNLHPLPLMKYVLMEFLLSRETRDPPSFTPPSTFQFL